MAELLTLVVRPEKLFFVEGGAPGLNEVVGTVEEVIYVGEATKYVVRTAEASSASNSRTGWDRRAAPKESRFGSPGRSRTVGSWPISCGTLVPPPRYFPAVREICDRYGVLLTADEVITAFGRTGKWFASEHWDIRPDVVTCAKGLGSGYIPIGSVLTRPEIAAVFAERPEHAFIHGFTFGGHAVGAAAALANLEILEREKLVENAATMGWYLLERLQPLAKHPSVGDIRGLGLVAGIELVKDRKTKERFPAKIWPAINELLLREGLRVRVGNALHLAPPLIVTQADIDEIVTIVERVITRFEATQGV